MKAQAPLAAVMIIGLILFGALLYTQPRGQLFCTEEAKLCPDGTSVGRNPGNNCEFDPCPLVGVPDNYADLVNNLRYKGYEVTLLGAVSQPFLNVQGQAFDVNGDSFQAYKFASERYADDFAAIVSEDGTTIGTTIISWVDAPHFYRNKDLVAIYVGHNTGTILALESAFGEQFAGAQPGKTYVSTDTDECARILFRCTLGSEPFFDDTGCGCQPAQTQTQCDPDNRPQACTKEYRPVCGFFSEDVQCIKYPCAQTFGNKCEACADEKVAYWTDGACPT